MSQRKQRPLSEVEIQILDEDLKPLDKFNSSASADEINKLAPPSLDELESINLPSLEELHMEHAYTSLHSQIVRNVKERMQHYDRQSRRKSYHGRTEKEIKSESKSGNENEKGRHSRKGSLDRRKRRSSGYSGKQIDTMTESEKSRRDRRKSFEKERRRMSYHGRTSRQTSYDVMVGHETGRIEYLKSFEILHRSRSCGARPSRVNESDEDELIIGKKEENRNKSERLQNHLQQLSDAIDTYDESQIDHSGVMKGLERLLHKFSKVSLDNKENSLGRKDTLTSSDHDHYGRKDTLTSADQDIYFPQEGTLENG